MATRNEAQVRKVSEASALQMMHSSRHQRSEHQSHLRKPRRRSHESLCRDNTPLNNSSPYSIPEYYGGVRSKVTRTGGVTGLLTVSEHAQQQPPPPRSPGTSASAGSQRSHQRQSPAVAAGSPRVPPNSHKAHKNDHLPIKTSVSAPGSTEGEWCIKLE